MAAPGSAARAAASCASSVVLPKPAGACTSSSRAVVAWASVRASSAGRGTTSRRLRGMRYLPGGEGVVMARAADFIPAAAHTWAARNDARGDFRPAT